MNVHFKESINLLRQNARSVVRELGLLNDAYFDIGVTLAERHLLIELSTLLYPTVGEIADRLLLDKSTASRLIAKSFKKGYVEYASGGHDKRKRFLKLTETGKKTFNAIEPIAFKQTKDALLTLAEEEMIIVYQGVALYAKGLKNARLQSQASITAMSSQDQRASCLVMNMGAKGIGGVEIHPTSHDACRLEKVNLEVELRGFGLEKILLEACLKEAKKLGFKKCCVDTDKETLLARTVFEEYGFQQKGSLLWKAC